MSQNIASSTGAGWIQVKPIVTSGNDIVKLIVVFERVSEIIWKLLVDKFLPKFQTLYIEYVIYLEQT